MLKINRDLALFYGIMLGDGCIGLYKCKGYKNKYNYNLDLSCNAFDDWPFINNIVLPLLKRLTERDILPRKSTPNNAIRINFCNKELFYYLKKLDFPIGKKLNKPFIPKIFYEKNLVKYIIQGFFATDGCLVLTKNPNKYYPRLESRTTQKILISQIKEYLVELGMKGYFYDSKSKPNPKWKTFQKQYKFQFNGRENLILFRKLIGFVNPKHQERFENFLDYSKRYDKAIKGIPSQNQKFYRINNLNGSSGI